MYHLILQATKPPRPHERETERQHFERMAREARKSRRRTLSAGASRLRETTGSDPFVSPPRNNGV